jgi:hypothetical protein
MCIKANILSRVNFTKQRFSVGPQVGYLFPVGDMQGHINLKGYGEFDNANRPDGCNVLAHLRAVAESARGGRRSTTDSYEVGVQLVLRRVRRYARLTIGGLSREYQGCNGLLIAREFWRYSCINSRFLSVCLFIY